MKKLIIVIISLLIYSCSYEWPPHYVTFEEAIEFIIEHYGDPILIRDTSFYDDGIVRNRVVYWEIVPPEFADVDKYGRERYYTSINIEIWNQPYSDRSIVLKYRQYGWEVLRWNKGNYTPVI